MVVRVVLCLLVAIVAGSVHVEGGSAPDADGWGPLPFSTGEYRLPPREDPRVRIGVVTEIWARTYFPLGTSEPLPLLVFLHGNHSTCGRGSEPRIDDDCEYTDTGTCPDGYRVVPNHEGYAYLAQRLASWGYVVVSINANRGINCDLGPGRDWGLNLARGRLVLRHLELISRWNSGSAGLPGGFDDSLVGFLDFGHVGLMGHSRGGEGVRAAYNMYYEPDSPWQASILQPMNVEAIFEIAAVDRQSDLILDAEDVIWAQLLPMCDGDVVDLQGVRPFDRMMNAFDEVPTQKSVYTVWGANHNFFNTEWQQSDSNSCIDHPRIFPSEIGSPAQQQVARSAVMALFRANVGPDADPSFNRNFNPAYELPESVTQWTRVDRAFLDSPNLGVELVLDDFTGADGFNRYGPANLNVNIGIDHTTVADHDRSLRAIRLNWSEAAPTTLFQTNFEEPGEGRDLSGFATLDFRVSRQLAQFDYLSSTDFHVALVGSDETVSERVALSAYADLTGPVGGPFGLRHPILQTVRIPLAELSGVDLTDVRGVRLTFDVPNPGASPDDDGGGIHLADVRVSIVGDAIESVELARAPASRTAAISPERRPGRIESIRHVPRSARLEGRPAVELVVSGDGRLPVTDALPVLTLGDQVFRSGRYASDTRQLTFLLTEAEYADVVDGAPATLRIGGRGVWDLGPVRR